MFCAIYFFDLNCKRLCCSKLRTPSYELCVFNVYLPCDTNNENDSYVYDYNEVLSIISHYGCNNQAKHCIISGNLQILQDYVQQYYQFEVIPGGERYDMCIIFFLLNDVPHTFIRINYTRTIIDHF